MSNPFLDILLKHRKASVTMNPCQTCRSCSEQKTATPNNEAAIFQKIAQAIAKKKESTLSLPREGSNRGTSYQASHISKLKVTQLSDQPSRIISVPKGPKLSDLLRKTKNRDDRYFAGAGGWIDMKSIWDNKDLDDHDLVRIHLDNMKQNRHNCIRIWLISAWKDENHALVDYPIPYLESTEYTGHLDLLHFDDDYFRLLNNPVEENPGDPNAPRRGFIQRCNDRGIIPILSIVDGCALRHHDEAWTSYVWNQSCSVRKGESILAGDTANGVANVADILGIQQSSSGPCITPDYSPEHPSWSYTFYKFLYRLICGDEAQDIPGIVQNNLRVGYELINEPDGYPGASSAQIANYHDVCIQWIKCLHPNPDLIMTSTYNSADDPTVWLTEWKGKPSLSFDNLSIISIHNIKVTAWEERANTISSTYGKDVMLSLDGGECEGYRDSYLWNRYFVQEAQRYAAQYDWPVHFEAYPNRPNSSLAFPLGQLWGCFHAIRDCCRTGDLYRHKLPDYQPGGLPDGDVNYAKEVGDEDVGSLDFLKTLSWDLPNGPFCSPSNPEFRLSLNITGGSNLPPPWPHQPDPYYNWDSRYNVLICIDILGEILFWAGGIAWVPNIYFLQDNQIPWYPDPFLAFTLSADDIAIIRDNNLLNVPITVYALLLCWTDDNSVPGYNPPVLNGSYLIPYGPIRVPGDTDGEWTPEGSDSPIYRVLSSISFSFDDHPE